MAYLEGLAAPVALACALGTAAILLALMACSPTPPRPIAAKAISTHVKQQRAPILSDSREWCLGFDYREGSNAFDQCVARWRRAENYEQQRLRALADGAPQ